MQSIDHQSLKQTPSAGNLAAQRLAELRNSRTPHQDKRTSVKAYRSGSYGSDSNIEASHSEATNKSGSGSEQSFDDLWAAIHHLVSNPCYINKFKSLHRQGYTRELLELAQIAKTKDKPANWFNTTTAVQLDPTTDKKRLSDRVLEYLAQMRQVAKQAELLMAKLEIRSRKLALKTVWRLRAAHIGVERLVTLSIERGRHPAGTHRLFWHLYSEGLAGRLYRAQPSPTIN